MAISRLSNSGIKTGILKYDSALVGYPPVMPAPTAADGGTGDTATVSFSAVSGATGYRAISSPGGFTGTNTTSPVTVSGLTAGTAYTFQVQAQNAVGYGGYSAASNSITPIVPSKYDSIATVSMSGATATFSSIPSTYEHLQIRWWCKGPTGAGGDLYMTFNNVSSGTPYMTSYIASSNTSNYDNNFNQNNLARAGYFFDYDPAYGVNANVRSFGVIDIFNYSATNMGKAYQYICGSVANSSSSISDKTYDATGAWTGTSAINTITLLTNIGGGNFTNGQAALYGIKA